VATPFVQGRLRDENLVVEIESACAHCDREIRLTVDSEMYWSIQEPAAPGAQPLLFMPEVDWQHFEEPDITRAY
jgi:hypothetical protein